MHLKSGLGSVYTPIRHQPRIGYAVDALSSV